MNASLVGQALGSSLSPAAAPPTKTKGKLERILANVIFMNFDTNEHYKEIIKEWLILLPNQEIISRAYSSEILRILLGMRELCEKNPDSGIYISNKGGTPHNDKIIRTNLFSYLRKYGRKRTYV